MFWGKSRAKIEHFSAPNIYNIQHSPGFKHFPPTKILAFPGFRESMFTKLWKCWMFLAKSARTGQMLNMLNADSSRTFNIFNISIALSIFLKAH